MNSRMSQCCDGSRKRNHGVRCVPLLVTSAISAPEVRPWSAPAFAVVVRNSLTESKLSRITEVNALRW